MGPAEIAKLKQQRNDELAKPDTYNNVWLYIGYLSALAGGIFGIFIGWHLYYSKKTLPDGRRVYSYNERQKRHGKIILVMSCLLFPVWLLIKYKFQADN
jgi:hypothetical protein